MGVNELISVIVPVYQVEEFLARCVDSLLRQTYRNIEVILVDDGSPDRCGEICDQYARRDPRIRVIHKDNGGLSDARNAGIGSAKGDFISFVDSDDWVHDEYIERLYRLLKSRDADIAICDFIRTSAENINTDLSEEVIYEYSNIDALQQYIDKFHVQMVVAWGKLYKKRLFDDVSFPIGRIHEDEFTTHKVLFKARKIVFTTLKLLCYRQREDSIMGAKFKLKNRLDALDALLERSAFFESIGLAELSVISNRRGFFIFRKLFRDIREKGIDGIDNDHFQKFLHLKSDLRRGKHDFKFRVFYEAYFFSPEVFDKLHNRYLVLKSILKMKTR